MLASVKFVVVTGNHSKPVFTEGGMKRIGAGALKHFLKNRSREELIADIVDLFSHFDVVKDYYETRLGPDDDATVRDRYKAIIKNEFFPARGFGRARLSIARKAVNDYKKVSRSKAGLADLMLYYVEMGVQFTDAYGDIDGPFYDSMEGMYQSTVKFIVENELQDGFQSRCRQIVSNTSEMGWGFPDQLSDIYEEGFSESEDD